MKIIDIDKQKDIFAYYTNNYINSSDDTLRSGFVDKQEHSIFVMEEAQNADKGFTNYNESFIKLLALESLYHDIGRFEQLKLIGNFKDTHLNQKYPNYIDHGDLGADIIIKSGLLKKLTHSDIYNEEVQNVIRLHSKINSYILDESVFKYIDVFSNYDLKELFKSNNTKKEKKVLSIINTAIVQDVDRLDIFRKIVKGIWIPKTCDEEIDPLIYELYKIGKLPPISEIKKMNKWNSNVGHLVRMSFIYQMNLVSVIKLIKDENLIDKVFEKNGNDIVKPAYDFAKSQVDEIIKESDGPLVRKKHL